MIIDGIKNLRAVTWDESEVILKRIGYKINAEEASVRNLTGTKDAIDHLIMNRVSCEKEGYTQEELVSLSGRLSILIDDGRSRIERYEQCRHALKLFRKDGFDLTDFTEKCGYGDIFEEQDVYAGFFRVPNAWIRARMAGRISLANLGTVIKLAALQANPKFTVYYHGAGNSLERITCCSDSGADRAIRSLLKTGYADKVYIRRPVKEEEKKEDQFRYDQYIVFKNMIDPDDRFPARTDKQRHLSDSGARDFLHGQYARFVEPRTDFTVIPNGLWRDDRLDFDEVGFYTVHRYVVEYAEYSKTVTSKKELERKIGLGKDAFGKKFRHLEELGYIGCSRYYNNATRAPACAYTYFDSGTVSVSDEVIHAEVMKKEVTRHKEAVKTGERFTKDGEAVDYARKSEDTAKIMNLDRIAEHFSKRILEPRFPLEPYEESVLGRLRPGITIPQLECVLCDLMGAKDFIRDEEDRFRAVTRCREADEADRIAPTVDRMAHIYAVVMLAYKMLPELQIAYGDIGKTRSVAFAAQRLSCLTESPRTVTDIAKISGGGMPSEKAHEKLRESNHRNRYSGERDAFLEELMVREVHVLIESYGATPRKRRNSGEKPQGSMADFNARKKIRRAAPIKRDT